MRSGEVSVTRMNDCICESGISATLPVLQFLQRRGEGSAYRDRLVFLQDNLGRKPAH